VEALQVNGLSVRYRESCGKVADFHLLGPEAGSLRIIQQQASCHSRWLTQGLDQETRMTPGFTVDRLARQSEHKLPVLC
jgi:hypothetical protein